MRATVRIAWLLLSLCLVFHSIRSNDDDHSATSVSKDAASVTPAPTVVPPDGSTSGFVIAEAQTVATTGAPATDDGGKTNEPTKALTRPAETTAVVTTPALTETTPSKPTLEPVPDQPQAPAVTDNRVAPPTTVSVDAGVTPNVVVDAGPDAATSSRPDIITQASTADSSEPLVTTPQVTIIGTSEASLASKTSGTVAPISLPGNTDNEGTTKTETSPEVSQGGTETSPEVSKGGTETSPEVSQGGTETSPEVSQGGTETSPEVSKGGTETSPEVSQGGTETSPEVSQGRTETSPEISQGVEGTEKVTGDIGTTRTPSILTKAGPPAAETLGTQAGTPPRHTSPTPDLTTTITTITAAQSKTFVYSLNTGHESEEEKDLVEVCRRLMANLQDGNCSLTWRHRDGKIQFDCVEINGKVTTSLATQYYEEITMKPTDHKTLIAILASCGALLIMIVILAVCASHHRKPYGETQQHLTEELQTVENGYHDNPTLEVMEVQPEMQEKKMALNGDFNDSWIVPIDNLLKEDVPDEEDTHL